MSLSVTRCFRSYTPGFCKGLLDCYRQRGEPPADLRYKNPLDLQKSDKDLWLEMPMGDPWIDAGLHHIWFYLICNKHLKIPDSWYDAIMKFNNELSDLASCGIRFASMPRQKH